MKKFVISSCIFTTLLISCLPFKKPNTSYESDFTIAFGSCNKQDKENVLWKEIKKNNPNIWVWGGDNIYSDSENMDEIKEDYEKLKNQKGYLNLTRDIPVLAT